MKSCTFGKPERIRRNIDFKRIREEGSSYSDGLFVVSKLKNDIGHHRLGVTISSSRVRLACDRNRTKRLIKEFFRLNKTGLSKTPYDIVVFIRKALPDKIDYAGMEKRLRFLMKKASVI